MTIRLRDFIARMLRPCGTPYTPASFGLNEIAFLLAVLRACPAGSTLHLGQCEDEVWVDQLREWSRRTSPKQFEADNYFIDSQFVDAVEQLLTDHPSTLICVDEIAITAPDGHCLMASIDNFAIITALDSDILVTLQERSTEPGNN